MTGHRRVHGRRWAIRVTAAALVVLAVATWAAWSEIAERFWLCVLAHGGHHSVRMTAAASLADRAAPAAVRPLIEWLAEDGLDPEVEPRYDLLIRILLERCDETLHVLSDVLNSDCKNARRVVAQTVRVLVMSLAHQGADRMNKESCDRELEELVQLLICDVDLFVSQCGMCCLPPLGERAVPIAEGALARRDAQVRATVASGLALAPELRERLVGALLGLLGDPSGEVRVAAVNTLGFVRGRKEEVANAVGEFLLAGQRSREERLRALATLGQLSVNSPTVMAAFQTSLQDADAAVRESAASFMDRARR